MSLYDEEKKEERMCPFRKQSIIYHNERNNPNILPVGVNGMINYDAIHEFFEECLKEKCMMYDGCSCMMAKVTF